MLALDNLIWLILFVLVVTSAIAVPFFLTAENLVNVLFHSCFLGMLVIAQALVLMTGHFDLSIESTMAFGPVIAAYSMLVWLPGEVNGVSGIVVALLVGALIGYINGIFIVRFRINPFLQTLAMLIMLRGFVLFMLPASMGGFPSDYTLLGKASIGPIPVPAFILVCAFLLFHIVIKHTEFGRQLLAVGANPAAATVAGIQTGQVIVISFTLAGLLASLGGFLMSARMESVTSGMGEGWVFMAFAGAVLGGVSMKGGVGSMPGALAGLLLLSVIENALNLLAIDPYLVDAVKGFLIFAAIVVDHAKVSLRSQLLVRQATQDAARAPLFIAH